jgi:hypothetical protein
LSMPSIPDEPLVGSVLNASSEFSVGSLAEARALGSPVMPSFPSVPCPTSNRASLFHSPAVLGREEPRDELATLHSQDGCVDSAIDHTHVPVV